MTFTSTDLKNIVTEARPLIERQLEIAELMAGFRTQVSGAGGDWSQVKALIKAMILDEKSGDGSHVKKIIERADFANAYADMLGLNMNEFKIIPPAPRVAADRATEATPPASVASQSEPSYFGNSDPQRSVSSIREGEPSDGSVPITESAMTAEPADSYLTPAVGRPNSEPMTGEDTPEVVSTPASGVAIAEQSATSAETHQEGAAVGESPTPHPGDETGPNAGGENVARANANPGKPFRPHCLNTEACAGMGRHHCNRCETAYLAKLDPVG